MGVMMRLSNEEMKNITAGSLSASMLSAIVKGIDLVWDIAKSLGTSLRYVIEKKSCSI